jgi:hypothetical protein
MKHDPARATRRRVTSDRPERFAMSKAQPHLPGILPVLSRGKHRNPVRALVSWGWRPTSLVNDGLQHKTAATIARSGRSGCAY